VYLAYLDIVRQMMKFWSDNSVI